MKDLNCLRCGRRMEFCRREYLQLGKTGWITGDWGNLLAGAMDVVVLRCPDCGKAGVLSGGMPLRGQGERPEGELSQITCSNCSVRYDCDYPRGVRCAAQRILFLRKEQNHGFL